MLLWLKGDWQKVFIILLFLNTFCAHLWKIEKNKFKKKL